VQTMSSKEIAELTGKDHADVLKDIRRILEQAEIDAGRFSGIYLDARNRQKPCYHLPKRECDLVVSGYSVKYRWAIIQRWHELEEAEKAPVHYIPQTHREAILAYAELSDGLQFCH